MNTARTRRKSAQRSSHRTRKTEGGYPWARETARRHRVRTARQQANAQADEEGEAMSVRAQAMLLQECDGEGDGTAWNADELRVAVELSLEDEEQMLQEIQKESLTSYEKRLR